MALSEVGVRAERSQLVKDLGRWGAGLKDTFGGTRLGTLRAVNRFVASRVGVGASEQAVGETLKAAWSRGPSERLGTALRSAFPRGATGGGGGGGRASEGGAQQGSQTRRSGVFALSKCSSGHAAAVNQAYIERDGACVASFGNIAEDFDERVRVWEEMERRLIARRGRIVIEADAPEEVRVAVRDDVEDLQEQRLIDRAQALAIKRAGPQGRAVRRRVVLRSDRGDRFDWACRWLKRGRKGEQAWTLPDGVKVWKPREKVVQRRLVVELASELPVQAQADVVRTWCEQELASEGVFYHAVVHKPERGNDPRNYHAHLVLAPVSLEREAGAGSGRFRFEGESGYLQQVGLMRVLSGNGPKGSVGKSELVRRWRESFASVHNEALARHGLEKRYDPRSNEERGLAPSRAVHFGPGRAALRRRLEAMGVSGRGDAWDGMEGHVMGALSRDPSPGEINGVLCALEKVRLLGGLAENGCGVGTADYEGMRASWSGLAGGGIGKRCESVVEGVYGSSVEEWGRRWRYVAGSLGVRSQRALQASRLVDRFGGMEFVRAQVHGSGEGGRDVRDLRSMVTQASAFREFSARVRAQVAGPERGRSQAQGDAVAEEVRGLLGRVGLESRWVLGEELADEVARRSARWRRRRAARDDLRRRAAVEVARADTPEKAERAGERLVGYHRAFLDRECSGEEREALLKGISGMVRAARLREVVSDCAQAIVDGRPVGRVGEIGRVDPQAMRWLGRRTRVLLAAIGKEDAVLAAIAKRSRVALGRAGVVLGGRASVRERVIALEWFARSGDGLGLVSDVQPGVGKQVRRRVAQYRRACGRVDALVGLWKAQKSAQETASAEGKEWALSQTDREIVRLRHPAEAEGLVWRAARWHAEVVSEVEDTSRSVLGEERDARIAGMVGPGALEVLERENVRLWRKIVAARARDRRRRRAVRREAARFRGQLGRGRGGGDLVEEVRGCLADPLWCEVVGQRRCGALRLAVEERSGAMGSDRAKGRRAVAVGVERGAGA